MRMDRRSHRGSRRALARHLGASLAALAVAGAFGIGGAWAANGSVAYTYDPLGRLTTASYDTGVCILYAYDANGNRLSEKILVTTAGTTGVWGCFNWNGAKWGP